MKRNWDMSQVSDGKLYDKDDFVAAECEDCKGCSSCCQGMGESIVLDPYDFYLLESEFACGFEELSKEKIELHMVDGVILPNIKMAGETTSCQFLNEEGRCSIHQNRPGICRLFPLGRIYENGTFSYFLQIHECKKEERGQVRVSEWLGVPNMKKYEKFIATWHYFLIDWNQFLESMTDEQEKKQGLMYLLMLFYQKPYDITKDFYQQFYQRLEMAKELMG